MMQTRPTAAGRTRESDNQRASVDLTCDSRPYSFENLYIEDELKQKLDALKTSKHDKPIDSVTKSSPADNVLSNECGQTEKGGTECYHEGQLSSESDGYHTYISISVQSYIPVIDNMYVCR